MTDEPTHIATAAALLDDPYATLSQPKENTMTETKKNPPQAETACTTPHYPNRETEAALQASQGGEVVRVGTVDALFADLNDEEDGDAPAPAVAAIRARAKALEGHTQGRWDYDCECVVFIRTGEGMHDWQAIATVEDEEIPGEEALANTAIMTAAPDLRRDVLALCEHADRLAARIAALEAEIERLREALAEAAQVLAMMTDQNAIKSSSVATAFACCVSAGAKARAALADQDPIKSGRAATEGR